MSETKQWWETCCDLFSVNLQAGAAASSGWLVLAHTTEDAGIVDILISIHHGLLMIALLSPQLRFSLPENFIC